MEDHKNLKMASSRRDLLVATAAVAFVTTLPKTQIQRDLQRSGKELVRLT